MQEENIYQGTIQDCLHSHQRQFKVWNQFQQTLQRYHDKTTGILSAPVCFATLLIALFQTHLM